VDDVNLSLQSGEFVAVVGSSGSGKSTLLNLLAGLDTPTSGEVEVAGIRLSDQSPRERAAYRASRVGMVFQSFNLIPHRTALQNVELALFFDGTPKSQRRDRAHAMLTRLGLEDRTGHVPGDLSGGEQQRVAIARALVKEPQLLFADEPTGNLDLENARQIAALLTELNGDGITVVLVTHDLDLASTYASRIERMHYGKMSSPGAGNST
jgi:putative ABC transport system ATP-binding protein